MRGLLSSEVRIAAVMVLIGLAASPLPASSSHHLINARAAGQDNGAGTTSGNVIGGGLLEGTIAGQITSVVPPPPPNPGDPVSTIATFTETVTFTTARGTLTVEIAGAINLANGTFTGIGRVTAATGKLFGATGSLAFHGAANFSKGVFTEDITGVICVDLAP